MLVLNTKQIFIMAGGNAALRKMLTQDVGWAPTEATVGMWQTRERISQEWAAQVVASLMDRNPKLGYHELLIQEDPFG
jgi:hypothetical protein